MRSKNRMFVVAAEKVLRSPAEFSQAKGNFNFTSFLLDTIFHNLTFAGGDEAKHRHEVRIMLWAIALVSKKSFRRSRCRIYVTSRSCFVNIDLSSNRPSK